MARTKSKKRSSRKRRSSKSKNPSVGGFLGRELKFIETTLEASQVDHFLAGNEHDPATFLCLNGIGQGNGVSQRIGSKYTIRRIIIRGGAYVTSTTATTQPTNRVEFLIALVQDRFTNGAQLESENVFSGAGDGFRQQTLPDEENKVRYKILWMKQFMLLPQPSSNHGDGTTYDRDGVSAFWNVNKRVNIRVKCNSNTGNTISAINDNSLHIVAYSNTAGSQHKIDYNCRLMFTG